MATQDTVNEQSTCAITVTFTDESDNVGVPNSATWTLTDIGGNVINSRSQVPMAVASSVDIVLSGDDLALVATFRPSRVLTVEALFDSTLGENLPMKNQFKFSIENLVAIS